MKGGRVRFTMEEKAGRDELKLKIANSLQIEEREWKQKSREIWLKEGDQKY